MECSVRLDNPRFLAMLEENYYFRARTVEGVGICALHRLMFTVSVCVGIDWTGWRRRYCFETLQYAIAFLDHYDGTPPVVGVDGCVAMR